MNRGNSETGAALLTVLAVLAGLGIVVSLALDRNRADIRPWARENEWTQATYSAESGIAFQLYLERFSDSTEPSQDSNKVALAEDAFDSQKAKNDLFQYHLDTTATPPSVTVDRTRAYLDITSTGHHRNGAVTVFARFGKALDDSAFGPALTMENSQPLDPFPSENINGALRLRSAPPGVTSEPWPAGFSVANYAQAFTDKKYLALDAALQKQLGEEGGETGNGSYTERNAPQFSLKRDIYFPLGRVEFINTSEETWVIRGPGRIFAEGEIRLRGNIRLENIQLLSNKDITFEDSVSGEENTAYARGSIFLHGRCHLGIEALAGKDIVLRDRSQTTLGSVLITVGNRHLTKGSDTLNAIRLENQARARGFLIAAGPNGRVVISTTTNVVEGVVLAASVWLAGEVRGPVLTQKLLCEATQTHNCLGTGKINRPQLPAGFVQPLQLGPGDRRRYSFKLMDWRRS